MKIRMISTILCVKSFRRIGILSFYVDWLKESRRCTCDIVQLCHSELRLPSTRRARTSNWLRGARVPQLCAENHN